jgi:uncharacterized RDD family membrane protein YckC
LIATGEGVFRMGQEQTGDSASYRVIFLGLVDRSDAAIEAFSGRLSKHFGIPIEKALSITKKAPVVLKKNISKSMAERYQQVFQTMGGQVRIELKDGGMGSSPAQSVPARVDGFEATTVGAQESRAQDLRNDAPRQQIPRDASIAKGYDDDIAEAYEDSFTPPTRRPPKLPEVMAFQCPQCGHSQPKGVECIKCGIIFEKHERMVEAQNQAGAEPDPLPEAEGSTADDSEIKIEPAGFWIRAGAYLADGVVLNLVILPLCIGLAYLVGVNRGPMAFAAVGPLFYAISLVLPIAYYIFFLGKRGYTPGKGFLGLQVIRQDGTGMSYGDAAIRFFSYIISSLPLFLGFLWIAFDRNKQGWHDKIARTQVIKAEEVSSWRKWIILIPAVLVPLVGIVAAIGIPVYLGYASRADVIKAVDDMQALKSHLEEHYYRYDRYPITGEFRPFLKMSLGHIPRDPFNHGQPYRYRSDGSTFTLWSIGPDREDNAARITYDPFQTRSVQQKGDIIIYSDARPNRSDELFGMTPEGITQKDEQF